MSDSNNTDKIIYQDPSTQGKESENYQGKLAQEEVNILATKVQESKLQSIRKSRILYFMTVLITALFIAAYCYAFRVLKWLSDPAIQYKDWHALITITALLVPPTLLGFSLIKSVFNDESKKTNINLKDLPVAEIGKVLVELGESAIKKLK